MDSAALCVKLVRPLAASTDSQIDKRFEWDKEKHLLSKALVNLCWNYCFVGSINPSRALKQELEARRSKLWWLFDKKVPIAAKANWLRTQKHLLRELGRSCRK